MYTLVGNNHKANQSILLVSRPPLFKVLYERAVIIHYSIRHSEGVASLNGGAASWNHPIGQRINKRRRGWHFKAIMKGRLKQTRAVTRN